MTETPTKVCDECNGTGTVHSHNPLCGNCGGSGTLSRCPECFAYENHTVGSPRCYQLQKKLDDAMDAFADLLECTFPPKEAK